MKKCHLHHSSKAGSEQHYIWALSVRVMCHTHVLLDLPDNDLGCQSLPTQLDVFHRLTKCRLLMLRIKMVRYICVCNPIVEISKWQNTRACCGHRFLYVVWMFWLSFLIAMRISKSSDKQAVLFRYFRFVSGSRYWVQWIIEWKNSIGDVRVRRFHWKHGGSIMGGRLNLWVFIRLLKLSSDVSVTVSWGKKWFKPLREVGAPHAESASGFRQFQAVAPC